MFDNDLATTAALIVGWEVAFRVFKAVTHIPAVNRTFNDFSSTSTTTTTRTNFAIFCNSALHSIASSAHAAFMLYGLFNHDQQQHDQQIRNEPHPHFRLHLLAELAYYFVDTFHEAREKVTGFKAKTLKSLFLLHHAPLLLGYLVYIPWSAQQSAGTYFQTSVLVTMTWLVHCSTPLQNFKWCMDKAGVDGNNSVLYKANFLLFVASFAVVRIYGIFPMLRSVVWIKQLPNPESVTLLDIVTQHMPVKCVVGTAILYILNLGWFAQNLRRARELLFGKGTQKREKKSE